MNKAPMAKREKVVAFLLLLLAATASPVLSQTDLLSQCHDSRGGPPTIAACTRLIAIAPAAILYEHRASAYAAGGDDSKAFDDFSEAMRLDGRRTSAAYLRGQTLMRLERFEAAILDFSRVIGMAPRDALALNARAWAAFKLKQYDSAILDAEAAIWIAPRYAPAFDTRAHIHEALGRRNEAIADFRKALALDPNDPLVHITREGLRRLGAMP